MQRKIILLFAMGIILTLSVNALCWNPLELFCIFGGNAETQATADISQITDNLRNLSTVTEHNDGFVHYVVIESNFTLAVQDNYVCFESLLKTKKADNLTCFYYPQRFVNVSGEMIPDVTITLVKNKTILVNYVYAPLYNKSLII